MLVIGTESVLFYFCGKLLIENFVKRVIAIAKLNEISVFIFSDEA